jgi:hypothetical protein
MDPLVYPRLPAVDWPFLYLGRCGADYGKLSRVIVQVSAKPAHYQDGWTQYNKMETKTNSHFQPLPDWVPMNTTGSTESGNLYIPFYDFGGDATMAGWRLAEDETSEVVYTLKDNYSSPNASYTSGHHSEHGSLSLHRRQIIIVYSCQLGLDHHDWTDLLGHPDSSFPRQFVQRYFD